MNVLIIDDESLCLDFALRCAGYDHSVRWYRSPKVRDGEGFRLIKIIDDWRSSMGWARDGLIVVSGNHKYMRELDQFRELGFKIFGPTAKSAQLEIDREAGMEALRKVGVDIPKYDVYDSLEAAEKAARKSDRPLCFKPMGDEEDKSLSFVCSDPAQMVGWIQRKIKSGKKMKGQCMLQEKIDMLAELGVSGWVGPDGFLPNKWQTCFEFKKLMSGDHGPNTGEMGTVCQYVEGDPIASDMLAPLAKSLRSMGHTGDFAVNCGIDKSGKAWPFEFTARLGWPAFYIQVASHEGDPAQWMRDLLDGKDTLKVSRDVAIGVLCLQPPWPTPHTVLKTEPAREMVEGNPISGLDEVYDDVHCASVMLGKGPKMEDDKIVEGPIYQTSGEYVLCATGLGQTVRKAMRRVYRTVEKIKFADMEVRDDIGEKLQDQLPALHEFGYAKSMEF